MFCNFIWGVIVMFLMLFIFFMFLMMWRLYFFWLIVIVLVGVEVFFFCKIVSICCDVMFLFFNWFGLSMIDNLEVDFLKNIMLVILLMFLSCGMIFFLICFLFVFEKLFCFWIVIWVSGIIEVFNWLIMGLVIFLGNLIVLMVFLILCVVFFMFVFDVYVMLICDNFLYVEEVMVLTCFKLWNCFLRGLVIFFVIVLVSSFWDKVVMVIVGLLIFGKNFIGNLELE